MIALHARRWSGPLGAPDGQSIAVSYLARTLCDLGYSVRGHRDDHRSPPPFEHPLMQWAKREQVPSFDADLIITTFSQTIRRVAQAAVDAGANDRLVYWHHHGGLPPDYGCLQAAPSAFPAAVCLPPSSWAVEAGGERTGRRILVPGASAGKGGHVARRVADLCPDLRWYVLRSRCTNEDVRAWGSDIAPGIVPAVRGIPVVCTDLPELRASLGASAVYVPAQAPPEAWRDALRQALASPPPRLVLPPYREVVAGVLEQLQLRRAA